MGWNYESISYNAWNGKVPQYCFVAASFTVSKFAYSQIPIKPPRPSTGTSI